MCNRKHKWTDAIDVRGRSKKSYATCGARLFELQSTKSARRLKYALSGETFSARCRSTGTRSLPTEVHGQFGLVICAANSFARLVNVRRKDTREPLGKQGKRQK